MKTLTDVILYVPNYSELVTYLSNEFPELLLKDSEGNVQQPPVVTGFSRTPAKVNGEKLLIYARLRQSEIEKWSSVPHLEVLSQIPYEGGGTADKLYNTIFNDPVLLEKYKSVYDYSPYETYDEDTGNVVQVTPPQKFGILAEG